MSRKLGLTVVIVGLTLLSLVSPIPIRIVKAQTTFLNAVPIDVNNGFNSYFPSAMVSSDGTMWLAWESDIYSNSTARNDILYQLKSPGRDWTSPQNITTRGQNVAPSLVQLANGTIAIFWSAQPSNNICSPACNIYYEKYNGGFPNPPNPIRFTNGNFNDTSISAAVDRSGALWIVWTRTITNCSVTPCSLTRQLYYRTLQGNNMSPDTLLINDPSNYYFQPSILVGRDGTVRVAFSKASPSVASQIYTVTYTGTGWTTPVAILPPSSPLPSGDSDGLPSLMQDRNGTIWVFWTRTHALNAQLTQDIIYGEFSYDNGNSFSAPSQLTSDSATTPIDDRMPAAIQGPDKKIWIFYISDLTGNGVEWDIYALQSSLPIAPVNHLAVTSITTNATQGHVFPIYLRMVPQSPVVKVSVTVSNLGDASSESFTGGQVTVSNSTTYNLTPVPFGGSLANGTSRVFQFLWNTTTVKLASYSVKAVITPSLVETFGNTGDSSLAVKNLLRVLPLGDLDLDGTIGVIDAGIVSRWFGHPIADFSLLPYDDFNNDGFIDIIDAGIVEIHFGLIT